MGAALDELAAAHAELARRQTFTDALLETIEVGIVACDADGVFVTNNRAERAMFGLDAEFHGKHMNELGPRIDVFEHGDRLAPKQYPLMRALRGDDVTKIEVVAGPAGGPYRDIAVRGRRITDRSGRVLGAVAALTDMTAEYAAARQLAEEHRRLAEAQRLGQLGSFEHDFATDDWSWSEQLAALWGLPVDAPPEDFHRLVVEQDRARADDCWAAAHAIGGTHTYDFQLQRANDGAQRFIRATIEVELDSDGGPLRSRGTHLDITDLRAAEHAAQQANSFFHAVLTAVPDYTFVTDVQQQTVIYGSPTKDVLGLDAGMLEALGPGGIASLVHPDDQPRLRELNAAAARLDDGLVLQLTCRARHADGQWRWLSHRVTPFRRDAREHVVEVLAVVRDVTDVVDTEHRLIRAARHDYLTGLPNRALLVDRLDAALARSSRDGGEVAVLFCDLDGFKNVNDSAGHAAGDAVLVEAARRLVGAVREGDTVARVGGDEFVVIVEPWERESGEGYAAVREPRPAPDRTLAVQVAERITDALRTPFVVAGVAHIVTASVGIAYATNGTEAGQEVTADEVLRGADAAMYLAKDRGKNRLEVFATASAVQPAH